MLDFESKEIKVTKTLRLYPSQIKEIEEIAAIESKLHGKNICFADVVRFAVDDFISKYNELQKDTQKVD